MYSPFQYSRLYKVLTWKIWRRKNNWENQQTNSKRWLFFLRSHDIVSSSAKFVFLVLTISFLKEIAAQNKQHMSYQLNSKHLLLNFVDDIIVCFEANGISVQYDYTSLILTESRYELHYFIQLVDVIKGPWFDSNQHDMVRNTWPTCICFATGLC